METFGTLSGGDATPTQLDIANRVEAQDAMLDDIANHVGDTISTQVDRQESSLRPIYKRITASIQNNIRNQAEMMNPVGTRVLTGIGSRNAVTGNTLQQIGEQVLSSGEFAKVVGGVPTPFQQGTPVTYNPDYPLSYMPLPREPATHTPSDIPGLTPGIPIYVPPGGIAPPEAPPLNDFPIKVPPDTSPIGSPPTTIGTPPPPPTLPPTIGVPPTFPPIGTPPPTIGTPPPLPPDLLTCKIKPPDTVDKIILPWTWVPHYYWSYVCKPGCPTEVYKYVTYGGTPDNVIGTLFGPYAYPVDDGTIQATVLAACKEVSTPPEAPPTAPPPPPEAPPTSPPPPPTPVATPILSLPTPERNVRLDWCASDPCRRANETIAELNKYNYVPGGVNEPAGSVAANYIGYSITAVSKLGWDILSRVTPGNVVDSVRVGMGEAAGRYVLSANAADTLLKNIHPASVGDTSTISLILGRLGAATSCANDSGIPIDYLYTGEQYLLHYISPQYIPSQAETDAAFITGHVTEAQWNCWTRALGNIPECRKQILKTQYNIPDLLQVISLYRQGVYSTEGEFRAKMRQAGVVNDSDVDFFLRATQQIPSPAVLQHYNVRDVFDPMKLGLAEIQQEYKQVKNLQELYAASGYGPYQVKTKDGKVIEVDPAYLDFVASYEEASPTQSYMMAQRIRPGREKFYTQFVPGATVDALKQLMPGVTVQAAPDGSGAYVTPRAYTLYDVAKNLKESDYNPTWRSGLAAISFRTVGRIDLRRLYESGVFGKPVGVSAFKPHQFGGYFADKPAEMELIERYQDDGYNRIDASFLAYYTAQEFDRKRTQDNKVSNLTKVCNAYKLGIITKNEAEARATKIAGDEAIGKSRIASCDLDYQVQRVKNTVAAIRSKYLRGEIGEGNARVMLTATGMVNQRINELVDLWNIQKLRKDKHVQANVMCAWYADGSLTRQDFKDRLINIGYTKEDADRVIKHCEIGVLAKSAKVRDRLLKARAKEEKRLLDADEKATQERIKAQENRMKRFLATRSQKNLEDWLKEGSITEGEVISTLILKGWSNADAERFVKHVRTGVAKEQKKESDKQKQAEKKSKPTENPT